jgi:hypothetical protein
VERLKNRDTLVGIGGIEGKNRTQGIPNTKQEVCPLDLDVRTLNVEALTFHVGVLDAERHNFQ